MFLILLSFFIILLLWILLLFWLLLLLFFEILLFWILLFWKILLFWLLFVCILFFSSGIFWFIFLRIILNSEGFCWTWLFSSDILFVSNFFWLSFWIGIGFFWGLLILLFTPLLLVCFNFALICSIILLFESSFLFCKTGDSFTSTRFNFFFLSAISAAKLISFDWVGCFIGFNIEGDWGGGWDESSSTFEIAGFTFGSS